MLLRRQKQTHYRFLRLPLARGSLQSARPSEVAQSPNLPMHGLEVGQGSLCVILAGRWGEWWASSSDLERTVVKIVSYGCLDCRSGITQSVQRSSPDPSLPVNGNLRRTIAAYVLAKLPQRALHAFDPLDQTIPAMQIRARLVADWLMCHAGSHHSIQRQAAQE